MAGGVRLPLLIWEAKVATARAGPFSVWRHLPSPWCAPNFSWWTNPKSCTHSSSLRVDDVYLAFLRLSHTASAKRTEKVTYSNIPTKIVSNRFKSLVHVSLFYPITIYYYIYYYVWSRRIFVATPSQFTFQDVARNPISALSQSTRWMFGEVKNACYHPDGSLEDIWRHLETSGEWQFCACSVVLSTSFTGSKFYVEKWWLQISDHLGSMKNV